MLSQPSGTGQQKETERGTLARCSVNRNAVHRPGVMLRRHEVGNGQSDAAFRLDVTSP
jgi:hypothetical protein